MQHTRWVVQASIQQTGTLSITFLKLQCSLLLDRRTDHRRYTQHVLLLPGLLLVQRVFFDDCLDHIVDFISGADLL